MKEDHNDLIALRSGKKQAQRSGDYWSKDDQTELYRLFAEGYGISQMALKMERTERGVFNQLDRAGLLAPQAKPRGRRSRNQCLCPNCDVVGCPNCGKECAYAGNI